jgi:hypothetical protein
MAMSFVIAAPDLVQGAAQELAGIRTSLAEAAATIAGPTTGVVPAAADEVSAAISALFGNFGQEFQLVSAQAQAFHTQFVSLMNAGAGAYLSTEVANAEQVVSNAINGGGGAAAAGATPSAGGGGLLGGVVGGLTGGTSGVGGLLGGLTAGASGGGGVLGGLTAGAFGGGGLLGGLTGGLLGGLTGGTGGGLLGGLTGGLLGGLLGPSGLGLIHHTGPFGGIFGPLVRELRALEQAFVNDLQSVQPALAHAVGGGASAAAAAGATPGAADVLGGLLGDGSGSGVVGGLTGGTVGGLLGGLTGGTSGLGGLGAQDVAAMAGYRSGASAAAAQLAPWQQALYNRASNLAKILGLSPVTHPVAGDPDLGSQVMSFGSATQTALADPDDNFFDAIIFSSPQFTDTLTSGFEPTLGLGAPGHTINTIQSPVLPLLNSSISIPVTDPIAPLFAALLPLGL